MTDHPKREKPRWHPEDGQQTTIEDSIDRRIRHALRQNIDYSSHDETDSATIFSFPGTEPLPIAVDMFAMAARMQPNNILTHTRCRNQPSEQGFEGTQELEREVIDAFAQLCGATNPEETIDGYLCAGGTTSILEGLWIGRQWLRHELSLPTAIGKIKVVTSITTHYAARKACWILDIPQVTVGLDEQYHFSTEQLQDALEVGYANGVRGFIIIATVGCSLLGKVDDVSRIADTLVNFRKNHPDSGTYLHIDAAFGGMILPFTAPPTTGWGFDIEEVSSITIDPHKANVPYPAGAFLCRKHLQDAIKHTEGYVNHGDDTTVEGSRTGAAAAACWTALQYSDYEKTVQDCMATKDYFISQLEPLGYFDIINGETTIFAIALRDDLPAKVQNAIMACFSSTISIGGKVIHRYILSDGMLPRDIDMPTDNEELCRKWYKIVVMPHVTRTKINRFVADLTQAVTTQSVTSTS